MAFLDGLKRLLGGAGGAAGPGRNPNLHWFYVRCKRCGEPLKGRVDLRNEPSLADDGETWVVRKGLSGSGARRCFQTIEVTLVFNAGKDKILQAEAAGGELITEEEYELLEGSSHA